MSDQNIWYFMLSTRRGTPVDPEIEHNQGFKMAYRLKKGLSQAVKSILKGERLDYFSIW